MFIQNDPAIMGFPRTRGDEPDEGTPISQFTYVFPARAGMSRLPERTRVGRRRFPRTRGDEPRG